MVEEDYHGQDAAHPLHWHLGLDARERGIPRIKWEVLPHIRAIRRVFASSGWPTTRQRVGEVIPTILNLTHSRGCRPEFET